MSKYNFFERKYRILESFYTWIEQGSTYDTAAEQCVYYNRPENDLDKLIIVITVATRFSRSNMMIQESFREKLLKAIDEISKVNLKDYLIVSEVQVLKEEVEELKSYTQCI